MNADAAAAGKDRAALRQVLVGFQQQTGQPLAVWALVAALNFATQVAFRRELAPGEFGTINTALALIGLLVLPAAAVQQSLADHLARHEAPALRNAAGLLVETFAWGWAAVSLVLIFALVPPLHLPRFSLQLFSLMNVLLGLGGVVSAALCRNAGQIRLWAGLLLGAVVVRAVAGGVICHYEPWAESGLAAFLLAGFITLTPALRQAAADTELRWKACRAAWDRDYLLGLGATSSVLIGIYLFINADRLVAQSWFGSATDNNLGMVNWGMFDSYQTAGLLARSVLWGSQPLLWILFVRRAPLKRTTAVSLTWFWIYLGALLVGALLVGTLAGPLSRLFCGENFAGTALFVPSLVAAMMPLGLLQGLAIFSLASRRHPECFVLGGCGIAYALLLYFFGRQAQLLPSYMFGGGLVALMIVLFVGVVRWGRKQP